MKMPMDFSKFFFPKLCLGLSSLTFFTLTQAQVFRCDHNEYINDAKVAKARGCVALTDGSVTVIKAPSSKSTTTSTSASNTVPSATQHERDKQARQVLLSELDQAKAKQAALLQEWNQGEPERRGDEHNYQKYLDRKDALKADLERVQNDIDSLQKELQRLPPE